MFIYSVRKGTRAEVMPNHVPDEIKSERFNRLKLLADRITEEENIKYVGTVQKVLVEGVSKTNENVLTGRTKHCFVDKGNKPIILKKTFPNVDKKLKEMSKEL